LLALLALHCLRAIALPCLALLALHCLRAIALLCFALPCFALPRFGDKIQTNHANYEKN
jgi:hypothetical protein